jgi:hypothetical protein
MTSYALRLQPLVWALLAFAASVTAQERLSVAGILFSAVSDEQVLQGMALESSWINTTKGLPLVERGELRTETNRFDWQRQSYVFRVTTNSWLEQRAQRHADNATTQLLNTQTRLLVHEQLAERYEVLFRFRAVQEEMTLKQQLLLVQSDKIKVLQRKAAVLNDLDLEEWIETEQERDENTIELLEAANDANEVMRYIKWAAVTPSDTNVYTIDTSGWIGLSEIARIITTLPDTPLRTHPRLLVELDEAQIFEQRRRVEQANGRRMLDYVQVQYQERVLLPWRYDVSIGLGIRLPYRGSNRRDVANLTLRTQQAEQKALLWEMEAARRIAHLKAECQNLFKILSVIEQFSKDNSAIQSVERLAAAGTDPLIRLALIETQLKRQVQRLAIQQEIYANFVELLDLSGVLSAAPLRNYFCKNTPNLTD